MSLAGGSSSELHGALVDALGADLVSGRSPAGHVLTLDGLGTQYGVSRSVAREAVRVLESMGMVASRRRVGITVQPPEAWHAFDPRLVRWQLDSEDRAALHAALHELRRGVEPVAAALAARRADSHQCRTLAAAVSDMAVHGRTGDAQAYLLADNAFHRMLLEASGNGFFRALNGLNELIAEDSREPSDRATIALHDDVARAIRERDEAAAEAAMRALVDAPGQAG